MAITGGVLRRTPLVPNALGDGFSALREAGGQMGNSLGTQVSLYVDGLDVATVLFTPTESWDSEATQKRDARQRSVPASKPDSGQAWGLR